MTLPILRALARRHGPVGLVHFDAHPDTWDEYFGSKFFHGTPFRRAVEEGLVDPRRMVQVGIRGPLYGADDFAFHEQHGLQCGYCTPGLVMAATFLLRRNPNPTEEEIRRAIRGNICRCTGYVNIVRSIAAAASGEAE